MIKNIFSAFVLSLLPVTTVLAVGIPSSGIDWAASTISVENFTASHPSHEANFSCFGATFADLPATSSLDAMAFSNPDIGPTTDVGAILNSTCFQQAGDYEVRITLVDQATNVGSAEYFLLTVRPSEAGSLFTTIEPIAYTKETGNPGVGDINGSTSDCTDERLLANAKDDCTLRVSLRDDFGNVVEIPTAIGRLSVPGRDVNNRDLNLIADAESSFVDGLRLNDGLATLPFQTNADGDFEFEVSALAPSIEIVTSPVDAAFRLTRVISRVTPFEFPVPTVRDDGTPLLGNTRQVTQSVDLQFEPWVKLFLSDLASAAGSFTAPNDPIYFLLGDVKDIYAFADTMMDHFLPDNFDIFVKGFNRPVGLYFEDEDLTDGASDIDGDSVPEGFEINALGGDRTRENAFTTALKALTGISSDENVAMGSKVRHSYLESGVTKTVLYPGGNLGSTIGNEPAFPGITFPDGGIPGGQPGSAVGLLVGADIEGKILADAEIQTISDDVSIVNVGGTSVADIREDVIRNAETLTRGLNPINSPGSNVNFNINSGFTNGNVAYFKDATVTLTGSGSPMIFDSGIKTVVIEDGSLFIPDDLQYASFDDSLGFILINSTVGDTENSHIFVKNTVQRIVGTYYAEGAVLSTTANTNPQYTDVIADRSQTNADDPNAPLGLQLLLEGTVLTRNTLGGALLTPARTPYGETAEQDEAVRYDLHFVRRYVPPIDPITFIPLPDNLNNHCAKVGGVCDNNQHSLVIRTDGRVSDLTPPGFDLLPGFSAQ